MSADPIAFGRAAAHAVLAQDGTRSNVRNLRPTMPHPAVTAGHPSVYDRQHDDERPALPVVVSVAVRTLIRSTLTPGSVARPQAVDAAETLAMWLAGANAGVRTTDDTDPTPAHGITRPKRGPQC
jgi:hypothetical protein